MGCVALDRHGHLSAGTSTGGLPGKPVGRVGDSAIVGAGTWASDGICAVSATGHGESFIRSAAAHHVAMAIRFRALSPAAATDEALAEVSAAGGTGGLIVLAPDGTVAVRFTTEGMMRTWVLADGPATAELFGERVIGDR